MFEERRRSYKLLLSAVLLLAALGWCVQFTARASPGSIPIGVPASPLAAFEGDTLVTNSGDWITRRVPLLRRTFLTRIYGALPETSALATTFRTIDGAALNGVAQLDLVTLQLGTMESSTPLDVALLTPAGDGPFPLIVVSDFCGLDSDVDPRLPAPSWRPNAAAPILGER